MQLKFSGVGTFNRGDFTATNAFFWSSINLEAHAGMDTGYTPNYIELLDNTGKKATGYIGAVGAGETLGSELIINGDMSVPESWDLQSGWAVSGGVGVATNVENKQAIYQTSSSTQNFLLKGSFDLVTRTSGNFFLSYGSGGDGSFTPRTVPGSYVEYANSAGYFIYNGITANNTAGGTIDNISFKRVTDPPATAVHIVSSLNGTTRNWASIESGFDPNNIASWKIYRL